jgi:hypothetical protein
MKTLSFKPVALVLAATIFFCASIVVFADEPLVTIDRLGGIERVPGETIFVPYFPYPMDIEGRVIHEGSGRLNVVELSGFINGERIYGPQDLKGSGGDTVYEYYIPWKVPAPGGYFISIVATDYVKGTPESCPAAPALAAAYVQENPELFEPGAIAKVGKETGVHGLLPATHKCDVEYHIQTINLLTQ